MEIKTESNEIWVWPVLNILNPKTLLEIEYINIFLMILTVISVFTFFIPETDVLFRYIMSGYEQEVYAFLIIVIIINFLIITKGIHTKTWAKIDTLLNKLLTTRIAHLLYSFVQLPVFVFLGSLPALVIIIVINIITSKYEIEIPKLYDFMQILVFFFGMVIHSNLSKMYSMNRILKH